ncbi:MAG TPA: dihydrofolate reductase family protein [Solirubrobacteraceae bacterium]|nr:dihydrofolate reductase family protein [Solirubrobacteraceae bacterium]
MPAPAGVPGDPLPRVVYSLSVSLDGFIAAPDGAIDWSVPDDELFAFHHQRVKETGVQLCGRRLYETMDYWETVDEGGLEAEEAAFARTWRALPKVVFSTTLQSVAGNARLAAGGVEEEVARLRREQDGDIGVGGAGLARACMELDLVDEWRLFVNPVLLGGGTPFFPALQRRVGLELLETRTFASRIVYVRYGRAGRP